MNFITALQADRLIAQIREESDPSSATGKQLFAKLGKLGTAAIPKILEALASSDKRQTAEYVEILGSLISDKTLQLVTRGLVADSEPRTVSATAWALASNKRFNVNRLVDLLGEDEYSKASIVEVLQAHKERLNVRQLLGQIYHLQPSEKAAVFKLIDEITTEEMVPDLLARIDGKDPHVKTHLINVLARFDRPDVNKALREALRDSNKLVRAAALQGIARSKTAVDVGLVSSLLLDPDLDVMNKAVDVIIQLNHPETAKYLIDALKAENEFSRRSAVEILNAIGTTHSVKYLLEAVSDEDWWVRSRASDALARIGGPRVVDAVLELIKDKDENIRRAAIEILNTCRDKRAVDKLIEATRDKDWWVSERAADALAEIGDAKALPAVLDMIAKNNRSLPVALSAAGRLGSAKILDKLLPFLQRSEKEVRVAAIGAVAQLAGEQQAEAVRPHLQQAAQSGEETVQRAVTKALQKLEGRTSTSGRYKEGGTATIGGGTIVTPTPPSLQGPQTRTLTRSTHQPPAPAMTGTARTLLVDTPGDAVAEPPPPEAPSFDLNALQQGDMIEGRYKYIQKIGKGAFGTVVLVEDTVVEERLILKFLNSNVSSDEEMLKRFVHELRYSRRITHKNVIRIYDFLYVGGSYAISMESFRRNAGTEIANEADVAEEALNFGTTSASAWPRPPAGHHSPRLEACEYPHQRHRLLVVDFWRRRCREERRQQLTDGYGWLAEIHGAEHPRQEVDERADITARRTHVRDAVRQSALQPRRSHVGHVSHVQGKAPLNEPIRTCPARRRRNQKTMSPKLKRYASRAPSRPPRERSGKRAWHVSMRS
jgi:serine/threonine-protein kinase